MTNAYDSLTRLSSLTYKTDDDHNDVKAAYGYVDWSADADRTTSTVRGIDYTFNTGLLSVSDLYYTYDKSGNITAERVWTTDDTKPLREKYTYDQKNQLTRHDSKTQNASFVYTYGQAGNILSVKRYAYTTGTLGDVLETKTYTYGDSSWADLLTKYNGKAITYDGIGNMTSYNGSTYTWQGRELRKITNGSNTYSYKYNADGIRTSKTVNGTTTEFFLNGTQILAQKTGDGVMRFFYDSTGKRVGFANGNTLYYYLYNLQGDVIAIVRASTGQVVAKYNYDAWGKCTVTNASGYTVGDKNPFRYRGYYYDTETGLYYLNSRYYNPEFGRFISVDGQLNKTGLSETNLFAYCDNNPINRADQGGNIWHIVVGAFVGGLIGGVTQAVSNLIQGKSVTNGLVSSVLSGAASGALAATGAGLITVIAGNAAISMAENAINQVIENKGFKNFDAVDMLIDGTISGAFGAMGGAGKGSKHLTKLGTQSIKRSFNALKCSGLKSGLAESRKALAYYQKNTAKYYKGFWRGFTSDLISSSFEKGLSSDYAKTHYRSIFGGQ
mgnify:CR=1 FL=1